MSDYYFHKMSLDINEPWNLDNKGNTFQRNDFTFFLGNFPVFFNAF